jgi:glutathione S-transferase
MCPHDRPNLAAGFEPTNFELTLFGRSSSHFTRVARIFAAELGSSYDFRVVSNLLSTNPEDYGGNPALRLPVLHTPEGKWFGALNISRVFERHADAESAPAGGRVRGRVVWPEDLNRPLTANAQELTLQAMSSEVALIMARVAKADEAAANLAKQREGLERILGWLDVNVEAVLDALPTERATSFLEVTLFCLVKHLEFRDILSIVPYRALGEFCVRFGDRASVQQTPFHFD